MRLPRKKIYFSPEQLNRLRNCFTVPQLTTVSSPAEMGYYIAMREVQKVINTLDEGGMDMLRKEV